MSAFDKIIADLRAEIEAAYNRGYAEGTKDATQRIIDAVGGLSPKAATTPPGRAVVRFSEPIENFVLPRAQRGAVGRIVDQMLRDHPGSTITELEQMKDRYDASVAVKSIGNQLRLRQGWKYRKDENNRWFHIRSDAEMETAGAPSKEQPAVNPQPKGGEAE